MWVEFPTHNGQYQVFKNDLGFGITSFPGISDLECSEPVGTHMIHPMARITCHLHVGVESHPATVKIPIMKNIAENDIVSFWLGYIENPLLPDYHVGVTMRVMRRCREDLNSWCSIFQG